MASVLEAVFCNDNCDVMNGGLALHHGDTYVNIWIKLGMNLNDGQAHKLVHGYKGDSGCRFCSLCLNAWSSVSPVVDDDGNHLMVCTMLKCSDSKPASDQDILGAVDRLTARRETESKGDFEIWEKAAGLVHQPHGLLQNMNLRRKGVMQPASQYVHDPMHCLVANGVMNVVLKLLLSSLQPVMDIYERLYEYVALWVHPKAFKMDDVCEAFNAARKRSNLNAKKFKAIASELLGLYPILAYFFQSILLRGDTEFNAKILAFLALCDVMDMVQAITFGIIQPEHLEKAINKFLALCVEAGWEDYFIKKFHWLLHLPSHLARFEFIPWCFTLERKHRLVKRFATAQRKTMTMAKSTYRDVINHELAQLRNSDVFKTGYFLVEKAKPSKDMMKYFLENFSNGQPLPDIYVSRIARIEPSGYVTAGDIVLVKSDTSTKKWDAGELWTNVEFDGDTFSIVTMYSMREYNSQLCAATWDVRSVPVFIRTSDILCSVMYKKAADGSQVVTLIPLRLR